MVTKKIKTILISLLMAVLVVCSGLFITFALAEAPDFEINFTTESVGLNDTIDIPKANVLFDEETVLAEHYVEFPDGRVNYGERVKLDVCGDYKLVYFVEHNGKVYTEERKFTVEYNNSSDFTLISGEASFISEANSPEYIPNAKYQGISVSAKDGATFKYNKVIDLNDNDKNTRLFEFLWTPVTSGLAEFRELYVTLRDYFDSNNYVVFHFYSDAAVGYPASTSLSAYAHCQKVYKNTYKNSLSGTSSGYINGKLAVPTGVILDYSSKEVIGMPAANTTSSPLSICDLDGQLDSLSGGDAWNGFSSGLATLEIRVSGVTGTANFLITAIDGQEFTSKANSEISEIMCSGVYTFGYDKMPDGVAGKSYPIPQAVISSNIYGVLPITRTLVLFNMEEGIPVIDNRFSTQKEGVYYVCYQAISPLGNKKDLFVRINVGKTSANEITYNFDQRIKEQVNANNDAVAFYDGDISGGYGNLVVEKSVKYNGKEVAICKDSEFDYFLLQGCGEYDLQVKVVDFINNEKVFTKRITAYSDNGEVVFSNPVIPEKIVSGTTFIIPEVKAVKDGELLSVETKINGNKVSGSYTVSNENELVLEYLAGNECLSYSISVTEKKQTVGMLVDYFNTQSQSYFTKDGIVFEDFSEFDVSFVNALPKGSLSVSLSCLEQKTNFRELKVVFTDALNANNSFYVSIKNMGEALLLGVNGQDTEQTVSFESVINIGYDSYSNSVLFGAAQEKLCSVTLRSDDIPFDGFMGEYVYFSVQVTGVDGASAVEINKIANQGIADIEEDETVPLVLLPDNVPITAKIVYGEEYVIPNIIGYDVITGLCNCSVSIMAPDYSVISDKAIKDKVVFNQFGVYYVNYSVEDGNGCAKQFSLSIYVMDTESPSILLINGYAQTAKVGEEVKIAMVEVSDNDEIANVYTYVFNKDGHLLGVPIKDMVGKEIVYKFTEKGEYLVRKVVFDSVGNQSYVEYIITVG